jgi:hypothetical protein
MPSRGFLKRAASQRVARKLSVMGGRWRPNRQWPCVHAAMHESSRLTIASSAALASVGPAW